MYKMLSEYCRGFNDELNLPLINRELDKELYLYIYEAFKSLEVFDCIKITGFEYTEKESEIKLGEYVRTRKKGSNDKKETEKIQVMYVNENHLGELKISYELNLDVTERNGETTTLSGKYTKNILIPLKDKDGCYKLKGKKYILMYQLVDSTTYTTSNSVVLKSIMPIPLKRKVKYIHDYDKVTYTVPIYYTQVFKNEISMLLLYFAKMGINDTLRYFGVNDIIRFVETPNPDDMDEFIYFKISQKISVKVNRFIFDRSNEVKSIIGMIIENISNRTTMDEIFEKKYWLEKLGNHQNLNQPSFKRAKARNLLQSVDRMIDMTTKRVLNLSPENKDNMYGALRWMFFNYNELKSKKMMDVTNKRLRDNEYIASLLTGTLSSRLYRAMSKVKRSGSKNLDALEQIFSFKGDILITELYDSGLFKYDDVVNDMDFFNKLKFTIKGPNSQGGKSGKTLSTLQRGIDPSFIGRIDLNVTGNSDPGGTGILTPFIKTNGLFISDKKEPESKQFELIQSIEEALQNEYDYIDNMGIESYEDYSNIISKIFTDTNGINMSITNL